jgi:hypothetical protein
MSYKRLAGVLLFACSLCLGCGKKQEESSYTVLTEEQKQSYLCDDPKLRTEVWAIDKQGHELTSVVVDPGNCYKLEPAKETRTGKESVELTWQNVNISTGYQDLPPYAKYVRDHQPKGVPR